MATIVSLVLFGLITDMVFSSKSECPPRPSVTRPLNRGLLDPDCDVCESLLDFDTDYNYNCRWLLNKTEKSSVIDDCKAIVYNDNLEQIYEYWRSVNELCTSKQGRTFDPQNCECQPCVELASFNSRFMKTCAPHFDRCSLSERLRACRQKEEDPEQLWIFFQDLKSECYLLTGQNITLPFCGCDVCWKLLDETSDFMTKCGTYMDRTEINQLMSTCQKIKCDPVELGCFKRDLEIICERKTNIKFEFPQCGCEECWLLFQTDSDFMKKCGSGMSGSMLINLMKICYANMDNLDHFMAFVDNLEIICHEKGNGYFKKEWCHCLDCLLPEDPTLDIWQDCIRYMSDLEKMEMRHKCLENIEDFNKDLSDECYTKRGKNVTLPECETCRGDNICIEVVVDYSPSAYSRSSWRPNIYWSYYFQLDIGRNKSLAGFILFGYHAEEWVSMCRSYDRFYVYMGESALMGVISYIYGTNISAALDRMTNAMNGCNACKDKHKYGIIVTDGYDSTTRIMNAVENVPEDITMIVIGLERSNVDNLLIMARNNPDNVYTTENFSLHSAISDDLRRRHSC